MFFAASMLHVHLMQWQDVKLVEKAVEHCNIVWESIPPDRVSSVIFKFFFICYHIWSLFHNKNNSFSLKMAF